MPTNFNTGTVSAFLLATTLSSTAFAADLVVKIASVEEAKGTISMAVYNNENNFRKTY